MHKTPSVLVCVTAQGASRRLLEAGKAIAAEKDAALEVLSVLPFDFNQSEQEPAVLEKLFGYAKQIGGEIAVYFSDDAVFTLAAHISKCKPDSIVVGFPGEDSNHFVSLIHLLLPELPIHMVAADGTIYHMLPTHAKPLPAGKPQF